jgi:hypothetical protein
MTKANTHLGTLYQPYRHTETSKAIVRTFSYALPAALHVHVHVQTIAPTTYFSSPRAACWQTSKLVLNVPTHRNSDLKLKNASGAFTFDFFF